MTRYALPRDLPNALRHLDDQQLDHLQAAVLTEQKRRGKVAAELNTSDSKPPIDAVVPALAQGKVKAIRAAFKAGVKQSQIARHFGVSQSDVRKALRG